MYMMDKSSLQIIVSETYNDETDECLEIFLSNGMSLIAPIKPRFHEMHLVVVLSYCIQEETIHESYYIPYRSILYVKRTNLKNIELLNTPRNPDIDENIVTKSWAIGR